ncbi:MAG: hypothetical protein FJ363_01620 [Gemmatimonadetes bacterium]|nr:hypothetical protein [Gemmatimonadota bacterium]
MTRSTSRIVLRALAVIAAAGVVTAAARSSAGHEPPQGGAVIQIRDFEKASIVEIVAWNATEPQFGLRTFVKRNGSPDRYHRLWVTSGYPAITDVAKAQGLNRPLPVSSQRDDQNCLNNRCAPTSTVGARVPDDALRKATENVEVKFFTNSGAEIMFTARRPLVSAYLAAVDSVIGALKK